MILYSCGINHSKLKVTTGRLVQCWLESPLCSLMVAGPRLISHLLAPISQSVTLPATWNLQLHLGLLKKARQPKWRRCSQWRLTCPVACCKLKGEVEDGIARRGVDDMAFVATLLSTTSSAIDVLHTCLQMCDYKLSDLFFSRARGCRGKQTRCRSVRTSELTLDVFWSVLRGKVNCDNERSNK